MNDDLAAVLAGLSVGRRAAVATMPPGSVGRADYFSTAENAARRLAARLEEAERAARRSLYIAEHLFGMVDQKAWRDSGGDDMQGHYEGDYRAETLAEELASLRAALGEEIRRRRC